MANAISKFKKGEKAIKFGTKGINENGNGSLMRILPACLYFYQKQKEVNKK